MGNPLMGGIIYEWSQSLFFPIVSPNFFAERVKPEVCKWESFRLSPRFQKVAEREASHFSKSIDTTNKEKIDTTKRGWS